MNDILTSVSGKRMLGYVAPVYYSSLVMQAIFQATGTEVDDLQQWTAEIRDQLFPQRATWGLPYWEYVLGLPTKESTSIEKRRQAILSKMVTRIPITPAKIRQIAEGDTGKTARVENRISPYTFRVTIESNGSGVDLVKLNEAMNYAKPAHLTAEYGIAYQKELQINAEFKHITKNDLIFCGTFLCGTYPEIAQRYESRSYEASIVIEVGTETKVYEYKYNLAGTTVCGDEAYPFISQRFESKNYEAAIGVSGDFAVSIYEYKYNLTGTILCGDEAYPFISQRFESKNYEASVGVSADIATKMYEYKYKLAGTTFLCGTYPEVAQQFESKNYETGIEVGDTAVVTVKTFLIAGTFNCGEGNI
ncbi:putative phage tail protein [Petroclostridium sp. X23]|uniref:putative phage tail protein n=1 Tax=Petroclostridium sp. X23 TaxID=3045146 RepID=UPI0024ACDBCA|nr:putative phage tail protein [Petroclostridium sp. X23]WHH58319.1 DUF2313 domain-containing protein [Petroclostridium sp. X23]